MSGNAATIGRYEILREIGRGAMGVVYEAHDPALDRTVALKVIQPSAEGVEARVFEERFLAEARIAAALHHPGIVMVHDVGRDPVTGTLFIALELVRGETLADLAEAGPLDWRAALPLVAQVARALHHAHGQGVVHRDVKPANIVRLPSGEAKVMDFGIARLERARQRLTTSRGSSSARLSTPPPSRRRPRTWTAVPTSSRWPRSPTRCSRGAPPSWRPRSPGSCTASSTRSPRPSRTSSPGLPVDVERVLARGLAKDPGRRYPTAEAFAEDLEDILAGLRPRHATGDDLVVVEESDSPLAALLATRSGVALPEAAAPGPGRRRRFRPPPVRPGPCRPRACPAAAGGGPHRS